MVAVALAFGGVFGAGLCRPTRNRSRDRSLGAHLVLELLGALDEIEVVGRTEAGGRVRTDPAGHAVVDLLP